ncbi:MAG TPA: OmpA family protein [Chitinophagaceae bacterium]|nr:OmpA family protein [Chitinophagaceae bacterium]
MRRLPWLLPLLALTLAGEAQKKSAIGFSFNFSDFQTPTEIHQTSLGAVLGNGHWNQRARLDPGFSVTYWRTLTGKLDVSARYNALFGSNSLASLTSDPVNLSDYFSELEASVHARAWPDRKLINPFLSAGLGLGNYWKDFRLAGYMPVGVGIQVNIADEAYVHLQANDRISFSTNRLPNNLFYSLSISQTILRRRQKTGTPPAIPVTQTHDRDNDGVPDQLDECPDIPGKASLQGCPDQDGDGVADKDDRCPTVAGLAKYAGCPIPDSDHDGINDELDKCPTVAGVDRYQGCPIPDRDQDGINDELDKCPAVAGVPENQGCPVITAEVKKQVDLAARHIYFASGSTRMLDKSLPGLREVARLLNEQPGTRLSIDGYTDNTGEMRRNLMLSQQRARAVLDYLVSQGVDASRLTATGHGPEHPIADNKTAAGRSRNRRVELTLGY